MEFLSISQPLIRDILERSYHNGMGIIVMTLCLAVYAGAYLLGEKILDRIEEEL